MLPCRPPIYPAPCCAARLCRDPCGTPSSKSPSYVLPSGYFIFPFPCLNASLPQTGEAAIQQPLLRNCATRTQFRSANAGSTHSQVTMWKRAIHVALPIASAIELTHKWKIASQRTAYRSCTVYTTVPKRPHIQYISYQDLHTVKDRKPAHRMSLAHWPS